MTKQRTASLAKTHIRAGEGTAIPITRRVTPRPDGTSAVELQLNLEDAPVPERRYVADAAGVVVEHDTVRFFFAQRRLDTGYRSLVIIRVSADPARSFITACEDFLPRVNAFLEKNGSKKPPLDAFSDEPQQTVALVANAITAAQFGREASLDFYQLSPNALRRLVPHAEQLPIEGVVRVDLTTSLMGSLIDSLSQQSSNLASEAT